ncbi:uncharacterized protein KIAA2013 homolog isoform X1 [Dreissena polymorpha]|uniref:uncharacterized protein KIAA2013 homolog isoform X1 n=1 Tax=Dreissena polymorpha TaxID=45954 RepID=UPI0022645C19|nr:uncharacterized protein KIAA2013 homolog isoform X1 [Dreissena polymorpha]
MLCCPFTNLNMWLKSTFNNSMARFNSQSRARKIIIGFILLLMFMYYLVPKFLGFGYHSNSPDGVGACLSDKLSKFQHEIDNFDAVTNFVPQIIGKKNYPAYVGNGFVGTSFDSFNGVYVRLNRALSVVIPYYPVVSVSMEHATKEEVDVLQIRHGLATRIQVFNTRSKCVTVETEMYAHRLRPSLLVQELTFHNPTKQNVVLELDQGLASGWNDAQTVSDSAANSVGSKVSFSLTTGMIKIENSADSNLYIGLAVASTGVPSKNEIFPGKTTTQHVLTSIHYTKALPLEAARAQILSLKKQCREEITAALKMDSKILKDEHVNLWNQLWRSGFSISYSKAADALNGEKINSTMYYVLSNVPAPLHDPKVSPEEVLDLKKTLHYPDQCYKEHTSLHSTTLWVDAENEDSIARIVTTWIITLEKQGCQRMISAGVEGVLQAMLLSIGSLHYGDDHLEMRLHPKDTHRDFNFHRINYGNNTHMNISVLVDENNKANIFVSLDRNDRPYYACDAGCLDPPVPLSKTWSKFPVKLTEPLTAILYVTADKTHMEELKHAIHVKEIAEAPAHEHHVIALHKHGHHFGGLPTIFWVSIAFLVIVFHLFLFKLIYNEYCQAQERYTRSRYNL